jgi:hypothetical protein
MRPTQPDTGLETHQTLKREGKRDCRGEHTIISPKEQKTKSRTQAARSRPDIRLQKGKMIHPCTPPPRLNVLWKDSIKAPLRQALMYLWKAPCDRLNRRKEKKEERIKREVRRMGRNTKRFFTQPTFSRPSSSS